MISKKELKQTSIIPDECIEHKILLMRGKKVMLDRDLAALYGVTTSNLNKAVARNISRFPNDFMLIITREEFTSLKFHFGTSSWGGIRKMPRAFTEHGILMLSSVLNNERAIQVNIQIMRTFIKLKELLISHKDLALKIGDLEHKYKKHDEQIFAIFQAIRELLKKPGSEHVKKSSIGFHVE